MNVIQKRQWSTRSNQSNCCGRTLIRAGPYVEPCCVERHIESVKSACDILRKGCERRKGLEGESESLSQMPLARLSICPIYVRIFFIRYLDGFSFDTPAVASLSGCAAHQPNGWSRYENWCWSLSCSRSGDWWRTSVRVGAGGWVHEWQMDLFLALFSFTPREGRSERPPAVMWWGSVSLNYQEKYYHPICFSKMKGERAGR